MESRKESAQDRLDSWKEIAVYLDRDVRTVVRWEEREGLPVHRHRHGRRATVFAFKSEIDSWLKSRSTDPARPPLPPKAPVWNRQTVLRIAVATVMVLVAGLAWTVLPDLISGESRALDFHERDWILIANLENQTQEPLFDDTLRFALEEQLRESQFVNVVPSERIQDVLQLMGESLDAELNTNRARQICLRDGNIRFFLTGQATEAPAGFSLRLQILDPEDGLVAAHTTVEVASRAEITGSVRTLARWARQTLGEQVVAAVGSAQPVEPVTTSSLKALQLYSEGRRLVSRNQRGAARELFERAVQLDPDFASAYMALAKTTSWPERIRELAQRAFDLSEGTSEREYYYIRGTYYSVTQEHSTAIDAFEALLQLYPDDYRATSALLDEHRGLWNGPETAHYALRA